MPRGATFAMVLTLVLLTFLAGCTQSDVPAALVATRVDNGAHSGITNESRTVIADEAAWQAWRSENSRAGDPHGGFSPKAQPTVSVDFAREEVLSVTAGLHTDSCFAVRIMQLTRDANVLTVDVTTFRPVANGNETVCNAEFVSPYDIVKVNDRTSPVRFVMTNGTWPPPRLSAPRVNESG